MHDRFRAVENVPSNLFLSADRKLLRVAGVEGVDALNIETDEESITNRSP